MNVLLTGANGFVGSHILEELLCSAEHRVRLLLRATSDTRLIEHDLRWVEVCYGSLGDADSLHKALDGVDVLIHCAGKTKAVKTREYYAVNADGTRNLVKAARAFEGGLKHLIYISSAAVSGPGTPQRPAREDAPPRPVSDYAKSKMLAEEFVRENARIPYTILRPSAVYGPGDRDFLVLFKMARRHLLPLTAGGRQSVSLIFARDVARAVAMCIGEQRAQGKTYHLAHPTPCTVKHLAEQVAEALGVWALQFPVPALLLYPVCALHEVAARLSGRPSILNMQKIPEYRAGGWVCATDKIREDLGFAPGVSLQEGLRTTLEWYKEHGWL